MQKTRILSRPFSLSVVPHDHGLIRGSVREWCRGGERGGKGRRRKELPNSGALLIAEKQYDLFRNMQIQQSLSPCLPKGPADSQSEREGGREGERQSAL